jgi:hypothetical protein
MSRRIRNANPVTLFPFLAVLMCTIGALVLLLVVISAQIRGTTVQQFVAERQKVAEPARPIELPPVSVEESVAEPVSDLEPIRVESIVGEVTEPRPVDPLEPPVARIPPPVPASDEQLAAIEALKSQAAALKAKYSDAVEELGGLSQKRSALDRQLKAVVAQEADLKRTLQRALAVSTVAGRQLAGLNVENRQIIELLEQSDELIKSERQRVSTPRHSLIPYDGQTGTIRKPIVIECAGGAIRFEAEDVELDVKRLEEYPPGANPLVAGIQTLFAYWTEQARAAGRSGVAARPYALLIVRPSGARQFQLARVLLQPLVGDYGYEFVEESFAYDVPATTDEAARKCREAVAAAFQMKPRGPGVGSPDFGPGSGPGAGDRPGGVVLPRGPIDVERLTQRPAASRGFFSSGNFRRRLTGESSGEGLGGSYLSEDDGVAESGSRLPSGSRDAQAEVASGQRAATRSESTQAASAESVAVAREAGGGHGPAVSLPLRDEPVVGNREVGAEIGERQIGGGASEGAGGEEVARGAAAETQTARQSQGEGRVTLGPTLRDDTPDSRRETNSTVAEFLAKARAIRERQQLAGGSSRTTVDETADVQPPAAENSMERGTTGAATDGDASTTKEGAVSPGGSSPAGVSGGEVDANGPASSALSQTVKQNERSGQRGAVQKRWGKSGPNATLGLERPVTIVVGRSRLLIVNAYQITPKPDWSELQTVNVCLKGLDMTANDWGMPGEKFYWVPVVTLRVEDGSESLGQLLEKSLEHLGVVVEHEPAFLESGRRD